MAVDKDGGEIWCYLRPATGSGSSDRHSWLYKRCIVEFRQQIPQNREWSFTRRRAVVRAPWMSECAMGWPALCLSTVWNLICSKKVFGLLEKLNIVQYAPIWPGWAVRVPTTPKNFFWVTGPKCSLGHVFIVQFLSFGPKMKNSQVRGY